MNRPDTWRSGIWYWNFRFFGMAAVGAVNFADAQTACLRLGLELATVHTAAENDEIASLVSAGSAWVGGSDEDEEGVWTWTDGSPFDLGAVPQQAPWSGSEPNGNQGESCLQFYQNGGWNDVNCNTLLPVVCMRAFQTPTVEIGSSFPAFSVVKGADLPLTGRHAQWVEIGDWTAAGYTSLMRGFEFDDVTGRFTLHLDGVYFATTQITLLEANTGNVAVAIITNQDYHDVWNNGCIVLNGERADERSDFLTSCFLQLEVGDFISVSVQNSNDNDYTVAQEGSGFSAALLRTNDYAADGGAGFAADKSGTIHVVNTTGWTESTRYRTNSHATMFADALFDQNAGRFTAGVAGTYLTSATVRLDGADNGWFGFGIMTNDAKSWSSGLASLFGDPADNYEDVAIAGVRMLDREDFLSVVIYANADMDYSISDNEGGFGAAIIGDETVPAVSNRAADTKTFRNVLGWSELGTGDAHPVW